MTGACDLVAEMLPILINLLWPSKKMSHDFVWEQSVAETFSLKFCFSHVGDSKLLIITPLYNPINFI